MVNVSQTNMTFLSKILSCHASPFILLNSKMIASDYIRQWILEEIQIANSKGIPVQVEGVYYNDCNIQELPYLKEEESYMKDYLEDNSGKIIEIAFDKIKIINN